MPVSGCKEFPAFQSGEWFYQRGETGWTARHPPKFSARPIQTNGWPNNSTISLLFDRNEYHSPAPAEFPSRCKCFFALSQCRIRAAHPSAPPLSARSVHRFSALRFLPIPAAFFFVPDALAYSPFPFRTRYSSSCSRLGTVTASRGILSHANRAVNSARLISHGCGSKPHNAASSPSSCWGL